MTPVSPLGTKSIADHEFNFDGRSRSADACLSCQLSFLLLSQAHSRGKSTGGRAVAHRLLRVADAPNATRLESLTEQNYRYTPLTSFISPSESQ